jgi:hypothetical protein
VSNPVNDTKVSDITRKGEYYRVSGITGDGKRGQVDIPIATLDKMPKRDGESLIKRGIYGSSRGSD